jgi:hypothetical protein
VLSATPSELVVLVHRAKAGVHSISVKMTYGETLGAPGSFRVHPPRVDALDQIHVTPRQTVTLTGQYLRGPGPTRVRVGGRRAKVVSATGAAVTFRIPRATGNGLQDVYVTTRAGQSPRSTFVVRVYGGRERTPSRPYVKLLDSGRMRRFNVKSSGLDASGMDGSIHGKNNHIYYRRVRDCVTYWPFFVSCGPWRSERYVKHREIRVGFTCATPLGAGPLQLTGNTPEGTTQIARRTPKGSWSTSNGTVIVGTGPKGWVRGYYHTAALSTAGSFLFRDRRAGSH